jgi:flagellar basal-body rod modification protein FlgD
MIIPTTNIGNQRSENEINFQKSLTQKATVNFDHFLQLFITQLKNQDPLKPLDPTQTVTQLASFSTVEQSIRSNSLLTELVNQTSDIQALLQINQTK